MRAEDLFAVFAGFVVLTAGYIVVMLFCLRVIADKGIKLIVVGLLTGIAATGYSILTRMVGELHMSTAGMQGGASFDVAVSNGAGAPMILSRLTVVLVLGGIARLVAESLTQPSSATADTEASYV